MGFPHGPQGPERRAGIVRVVFARSSGESKRRVGRRFHRGRGPEERTGASRG